MDLYTLLSLLWWFLLGVLLIGFAIMDGFDLGVGTMLPFVGRTDIERRVVVNTVGPFWEGNQVWLLLGGGAIFAAFASLYALSFTGFYTAMLLILLALILRPVGFKFRSKVESPVWRNVWDYGLTLGGLVPALVCGVAFGNVILGVPFTVSENGRQLLYDHGAGHLFFLLFNPNGLYVFTLLTGLVSVGMCLLQGGNYLALKTEGVIQERAAIAGRVGGLAALALFILCGLLVATVIKGYVFDAEAMKRFMEVGSQKWGYSELGIARETGAWMNNYAKYPFFIIAPVLAILGLAGSLMLNKKGCFGKAFIASSVAIFGIISTAGTAIFPFFLPSVSDPSSSVLVWNVANSKSTLLTMTIVAVIFVPIVIAYTAWVHHKLRGTVRAEDILADGQSY